MISYLLTSKSRLSCDLYIVQHSQQTALSKLPLLAVDLQSYLFTCLCSFPRASASSPCVSPLSQYTSASTTFCFALYVKWRVGVQRLTKVCSATASQKDKLMSYYVTKVCSLPPTLARSAQWHSRPGQSQRCHSAEPNQEEIKLT